MHARASYAEACREVHEVALDRRRYSTLVDVTLFATKAETAGQGTGIGIVAAGDVVELLEQATLTRAEIVAHARERTVSCSMQAFRVKRGALVGWADRSLFSIEACPR